MPSTSPRAATTGPRNQRKRPGDLTGVRNQKLVAEVADKQEEEAAQAAEAAKADYTEKVTSVVDYTDAGRRGATPVTEVTEEPVEVKDRTVRIRVNYPIEQMTFGKEVLDPGGVDDNGDYHAPVLGNLRTFDFEEGRAYDVDPELAAHLKGLGYVYDFTS